LVLLLASGVLGLISRSRGVLVRICEILEEEAGLDPVWRASRTVTGCHMHFSNGRTIKCFRGGYRKSGYAPTLLERMATTRGAIYHEYDTDELEVDWPVCEGDEEEGVKSLEKIGCYVGVTHYHLGTAHVHAVCPAGATDRLIETIRNYDSMG